MVVDGYDVVTHLAAHQSNLAPPEVPHTAALVVLPTPAILHALLGAEVDPFRRRWMRDWAARLGGGDGPLPVVDLDADERTLGTILRELAQRGCERLFVIGARDQPGFARELVCRWPAELHLDVAAHAPDLPSDLAATLHEDGPAIRTIGGARLVVAICDDADPNAMVAAARRDGTWAVAYARDPSRAAGAWHGFVPPAALYGTDAGNRVREIWRRYWADRGHAGAVRHAVLGLDPDLERRLAEPADVAPTVRRARIFAVTGLDGAGKSTHAAALQAALEARGRRSRILKLYRQGAFLALADELSGRTRRGAPLAAFRVSRIVKLVDSLRVYRDQLRPALDSLDAVVVDRYTETHRAAAAAQLGWDLTQHPVLALFPPADRAFWLGLDADEAVRRLHARGGRLTADEHTVGLAGYAEAFRLMTTTPTMTPAATPATTPADIVLEADAPFAENAARIAAEALTVAPPIAGGLRATSADPIASAPAERARTHPLPVDLGGAADGVVLGGEVVELAMMLRDRLERAADGVTAAFWIEAYAAQLVLDARCATAAAATIAIWPAALRRMPLFADLAVVDELTRLLDAAVSVRSFTAANPAADPLWTLIAPSPAARARLAAEYRDAVAAIARERAWPDASAARLYAHVCAPKTSTVGVFEPIVDETLTHAQ